MSCRGHEGLEREGEGKRETHTRTLHIKRSPYLRGKRLVRVEVLWFGHCSVVGLVDDVAQEGDGGRSIDTRRRLPARPLEKKTDREGGNVHVSVVIVWDGDGVVVSKM